MHRTARHIGIIPDGNRRWATQHGMQKEEGYAYGLQPALHLLRSAKREGVQELTYYGFTVDNCKRPKAQFSAFSDACCKAVELLESEDVLVRVVGNTQSACFPDRLRAYTERKAADDNRLRVNLLVNYSWEWDLKNGWPSQDVPRIDMVIRWGGMRRLSGFLPLQTVYSDFYIVNDLWPDYQESHLYDALQWYKKQDVTLGG